MKYLGSKTRVAKELVVIIQRYIDCNGIDDYYEPFCGGCNVIDKIYCKNKYASDNHKYLIDLLEYARDNWDKIPSHVSESQFNEVKNNIQDYPAWYAGLVGFCATFSAKWLETYARDRKTGRDISSEGIRNLKKQAPNLSGIQFKCCNYTEIGNVRDSLIYCDPPYRGTAEYSTSKEFNHENFYSWVRMMSRDNIVLVSEYNMPDDFECLWEKEVKVLISSDIGNNTEIDTKRVERLFKWRGSKDMIFM